jgi:shikimate kinase
LLGFIQQQLQQREPYYTKAAYTLDVTLMDNYEKIKITVDKLKELLNL